MSQQTPKSNASIRKWRGHHVSATDIFIGLLYLQHTFDASIYTAHLPVSGEAVTQGTPGNTLVDD